MTLGLFAMGCCPMHKAQNDTSMAAMKDVGKPIVVFNITSDPMVDPHPVTMALQLAGHALDDGRHVLLFFNVKAVEVPTKGFPADLGQPPAPPIKQLLAELIEDGAEVHECPMCMKLRGVTAADLVDGAMVTSREALFSRLGPNSVVFSY